MPLCYVWGCYYFFNPYSLNTCFGWFGQCVHFFHNTVWLVELLSLFSSVVHQFSLCKKLA